MLDQFNDRERGLRDDPDDITTFSRYNGGPIKCAHGERPCLIRAVGNKGGVDGVSIYYECYAILRYTPCGVWVDRYEGEKLVDLRASKQWASATEAEALEQLHYRKRAQVRILSSRLDAAEMVLAHLDKVRGKLPAPRCYVPEYDYY